MYAEEGDLEFDSEPTDPATSRRKESDTKAKDETKRSGKKKQESSDNFDMRATENEEEEGEFDDDECPPTPQEEREMLFLIEFLVDTLLLKPENMEIQGMDPCLLQGQTCICLTFLHFPPMCICEKDVDPCKQTGMNYIKYNSGKSLMFALSEAQFDNPPPIYLGVEAYKMLPHGTVPNRLQIGMTKICLGELFKQVFDKLVDKPDKLPLSKSIKDKYQLVGKRKKCPTAEVTIYMRLSCLGQNVVTEFQRGGNETEPFLFKNKESKKVYQCLAKDMPDDDAEELCPPIPGWGLSAGKDCGDVSPALMGGARNCVDVQDLEPAPRVGPVLDEADEFEEFGTEVHGHALTIKIQKSQKQQHLAMDEVQSLAKSKSTASCGKSGAGNQITFQVPQSAAYCNKGKTANKAALYSINSQEGDEDSALRVAHGVDSPDKDIFVLRIGKKGETNGKGKLELELRTPKPKIERPINQPRKWDKMVQTEADEKEGKGKKKRK